MTFCKVCGKLLPNVRFDPKETVICQNCADRMKEDLVRVVRCKDCKKRNSWECWQYFFGRIKIQDDWYCADGEKADT